MKPLYERMKTPIDGPLTKPIMTISQHWYEARVEEVEIMEKRLRLLEGLYVLAVRKEIE